MSRENDFPRQLEFYCQARTGIKKNSLFEHISFAFFVHMCENDRQRSIYSTPDFAFCILVFNIFEE